ncbi:hypothetical protein GH714_038159 [Hevea brasiliensis]|uniref:Uncharacterized protein n=1 Tax=Hevea brasiliensis TaxID=3981 RepID=A0A6A6MN17_HEVBR|nr:hypothetical protein GH714_038159 [Hevea brasiliensis]
MQRSSSSSWVPDESFKDTNTKYTDKDQQQLPTYDPLSHVAKKERSRLRSAENAIHLIPLVLVLCAIILWIFSSPVISYVIGRGARLLKLIVFQMLNIYIVRVKGLKFDGKPILASVPRVVRHRA